MSAFKDDVRNAIHRADVGDKDEYSATSTNTIIVEEYIKCYAPVESYTAGVAIRTTGDIINELADMADLDPDEVNAVLIREGYHPGRNNSGSFGWMMRLRGPRAE